MGLSRPPSPEVMAVVSALAMCDERQVTVHGMGHDGNLSRVRRYET